MFLFKYIIKLLVGNSETLFMGLVMVIFGYYGWLLCNINDRLKNFKQQGDKRENTLEEIKNKLNKLDERVYKEFTNKLNEIMFDLKELNKTVNENSINLERNRVDIIEEVKESADEIKEIMKILMNNRSRNITGNNTNKKVLNKIKNKER